MSIWQQLVQSVGVLLAIPIILFVASISMLGGLFVMLYPFFFVN